MLYSDSNCQSSQTPLEKRKTDTVSDHASKISFRLIDPSTRTRRFYNKRTRKLYRRVRAFFQKRGLSLDVLNTRIPEDGPGSTDALRELCKMPRMTTIGIGSLINTIVAGMPDDQCFVNVGVWHGFSLLCGMANNPAKRCIGIDNFSQFGGPKEVFSDRFDLRKSSQSSFYDMDYVEYFTKIHHEPIGFYIYDGEHSYANQFNGLKVAEPFFAPNCLVLVDDTNWNEPRQATLDFLSHSSFGYKIIVEKSTANNGHPTWWNGILLAQKIS